MLLIVFAAADSINELASVPMRLPCLSLFCFSLIRSRSTRLFSTMTQKQSDLLLEGDEFFVGHDGVCRTYYELETWNGKQPLCLEEAYDLKLAHKTFVLRRKTHYDAYGAPDISLLSKLVEGVVNIGKPQSRIQIQEIDQGVFGSAGTGATTWESSIAMSLLFSSQPELLKGDVMELGSGVGVGGILTYSAALPSLSSLTLTDGNNEVLNELRKNCHRANVNVNVKQLDWHAPPKAPKYDTILASDCAYKYPDVLALAAAMKVSLKPSGKIHIFGPYNRGALQELLVELRDQHGMVIQVNGLELNRYRLKSVLSELEQESLFASRHLVKFLHITATPGTQTEQQSQLETMQDID